MSRPVACTLTKSIIIIGLISCQAAQSLRYRILKDWRQAGLSPVKVVVTVQLRPVVQTAGPCKDAGNGICTGLFSLLGKGERELFLAHSNLRINK